MSSPGDPELPYDDADAASLIDVWNRAMADLLAAAVSARPQGWGLPTPCPGWGIGDIVAHTSFIERFLLKRWDPPHEPDWASLPHVTSDFGRVTEIPVDLRRGWTREEVLDEFRQTWGDRLQQLRAGTHDLTEMVDSPFGVPWPLDRVLRTRIFDIWVHDQDIHTANSELADLDTPAAWVSARQLVKALPVVWAKNTDAPAGSSLRVDVTGPGVEFTAAVQRGNDGRSRFIDPDTGHEAVGPTVSLRVAWPDLVRLMAGRGWPESAALSGDPELGQRVLDTMTITP
jgi:uncharacterized protein (TIGR03083 family)